MAARDGSPSSAFASRSRSSRRRVRSPPLDAFAWSACRPTTGARPMSRLNDASRSADLESVDDRVALLPQELRNVVHRQAGLAGRARALPAAERLDPRPRPGCRAGPSVDVQDAGLGRVEEALDLAL